MEIAIVGMACRFPAARNIQEYWELLRTGREGISRYSEQELLDAGVQRELVVRSNYVRSHGYLADKDLFDAELFGYSARDASFLDPQFCMLHECAWEALEDAGYDSDRYEGLIGLYAGAGSNHNWLLTHVLGRDDTSIDYFTLNTLVGADFLCTRVAYKLNLKGPAVTVQTACSTSLAAIHLACQALINGECDMALAGGASVTPLGKCGYLHQEDMILSADGHCRPFDAQASGTVPAEGVGLVVLKRLEDALQERASILAIIKGSAINNDGNRKAGFTAPSVHGQVNAINAAQRMAEVAPRSISYVEAHGTGTQLGDPIEIEALTRVFGSAERGFCSIGSVKSNLGHLDAAAGVAGVIKVVLSLQHRQLPPSLHFRQPNPQIDFANSPFRVNASLCEWPRDSAVLRAGVSSFGIGGTNAHVVLEEHPSAPAAQSAACRRFKLLGLSANSASALANLQGRLQRHLLDRPGASLADVCYTINIGRRCLPFRSAFVIENEHELADLLGRAEGTHWPPQQPGTGEVQVGFLFPGEDSQYIDMGRELYEAEPVFRQHMDRCFGIGREIADVDLQACCHAGGRHELPDAEARFNLAACAQPMLFSLEYSLAQLLMHWGCRPSFMIGHGIGEYAAACIAGVMSLRDAMYLVIQRGRLVQGLPRVAMLSIGTSTIAPYITRHLRLAAHNSPDSSVIAGDEAHIDELQRRLQAQQVRCARLGGSHALHPHHVESVLPQFEEILGKISFAAPQIPLLSTLTGDWIASAAVTSPHYWVRQLRECVQFSRAFGRALQGSGQIFLEVGPSRTLTAFAQQIAGSTQPLKCFATLPNAGERQSEQRCLLNALANCFSNGVNLNWQAFYRDEERCRVAVPTYPFEGKRYWSQRQPPQPSKPGAAGPAKHSDIAQWHYLPSWEAHGGTLAFDRSTPSRHWWILADRHGLGELLAARLRALGENVSVVQRRHDDAAAGSAYTLDPHYREDCLTLAGQIQACAAELNHVVYLWSISRCAADDLATQRLDLVQQSGFDSVLHLAKALGERAPDRHCHLTLVTHDSQRIASCRPSNPLQAALAGLSRVIPQEYPRLSSRVIDIHLPEDERWEEELPAEQLLCEIAARDNDPLLAVRHGIKWKPELRGATLGATGCTRLLQDGGVYLITGGLGRIGLQLAGYLGLQRNAKVIVTSRSGVPEKDTQMQRTPADPAHSLPARIHQLQGLRSAGADIEVVVADVCDCRAMDRVFERIEADHGRLDGVIHLAAHLGLASVGELDTAQAEKFFQAKVSGAMVLERCLRERHAGFCMLFSSLSSVLGGVGLAAYAAASSALDAWVQSRARTATPWICVNWDNWGFDGAAGYGLAPLEGVEVFCRSLGLLGVAEQVIIATGDLHARYRAHVRATVAHARDEEPAIRSTHARPSIDTQYAPPRNDVEAALTVLWQELLGLSQVGIHDSFFALGGDSLLTTSLLTRVRSDHSIELTMLEFFERPTIAAMANTIAAHAWAKRSRCAASEHTADERQRFSI